MVDKEEVRRLSAAGMKHIDIAKKMGCSKQYINQLCYGIHSTHRRRVSLCEWIVFPEIRQWLFENQICIGKFTQMLGMEPMNGFSDKVTKCLKGEKDFKFREIKKILEITGMSFEKAFRKEGENG